LEGLKRDEVSTGVDIHLEILNKMTEVTALSKYLYKVGPGPISDTNHLDSLLAECWDALDGSDAEGMEGYKLNGRIEDAEWNPPALSFTLERHGGTVLGSSRAELQEWNIDINARTATCSIVGHRQIHPMAPRLDVLPLAQEVVKLILEGKKDERLTWYENGSVRVHIGKILTESSAMRQTLAGRRKRFRNAVESLLGENCWTCIRPNVYQPPAS